MLDETTNYPQVELMIAGQWAAAASGDTLPVYNPATGEEIGTHACAGTADLDRALEAADSAFKEWRKTSAHKRYKLMRKAANLMRERADSIARLMTMEQGKPLAHAKGETVAAADVIDWFAEEGRRAYGRIVPSRRGDTTQMVLKQPVGPVAAFTPWNFPLNQAVRKISPALAAGCSIILKGPEDTPASVAELVRAFVDAGVPAGTVNLVYGKPAEISEYLIPHPVIRKVSFTGSVGIGKQLAALAGQHMKRNTMELGGHAPTLVFGDADLKAALKTTTGGKHFNAGQVCIAPTRFLVQDNVFDEFVDQFTAAAKGMKLGDGLKEDTQMGPLAHDRRPQAVDAFVADAREKGADIRTGGHPTDDKGYFYEPTVITGVNNEMKIMNEEPFGPVAVFKPFHDLDEAFSEANRLPYALAAYAYTDSLKTATALGNELEAGVIGINNANLTFPETPFGGIKDSGYGSEGGSEGIESYLVTKFVSQTGA
jgi:succinate-semialdehyde dehydrogenase/glutarate-semialdehyde dehydrogenase